MSKIEYKYSEEQLKTIFDEAFKEVLEVHRRVISGASIGANEISVFCHNVKTFEDLLIHIKWLNREFYDKK